MKKKRSLMSELMRRLRLIWKSFSDPTSQRGINGCNDPHPMDMTARKAARTKAVMDAEKARRKKARESDELFLYDYGKGEN